MTLLPALHDAGKVPHLWPSKALKLLLFTICHLQYLLCNRAFPRMWCNLQYLLCSRALPSIWCSLQYLVCSRACHHPRWCTWRTSAALNAVQGDFVHIALGLQKPEDSSTTPGSSDSKHELQLHWHTCRITILGLLYHKFEG